MIIIKRLKEENTDFQKLVKELDADLKIRDGDDHLFFAKLNTTNSLNHLLVAYDGNEAVGIGALRVYEPHVMEVKRMYVVVERRGEGIASLILNSLEDWCRELKIKKTILETGIKQPEAIRLYEKNNYKLIPNYGHYKNVEASVCFEKIL
jgi:putative acetyltransferase